MLSDRLGTVPGEDPHRVAPAETAREQAARAGLGQLVDLAVRIFTGTLPVDAIDQRGGAGRPFAQTGIRFWATRGCRTTAPKSSWPDLGQATS